MTIDCYCDYEPASIYRQRAQVARKEHKCDECHRAIKPGERYESTFGIWDGDPTTFKTCPHCLAVREWVKAHVPCFCWAHGNTLEDAREEMSNLPSEAIGTGVVMGYLRRVAAGKRASGWRKDRHVWRKIP